MEPEKTTEIGPNSLFCLEIHHCSGLQSHEVRVPSVVELATNKMPFWAGSFWDLTGHEWREDGRGLQLWLRFYDPGNTQNFGATIDLSTDKGSLERKGKPIFEGSLLEISLFLEKNELPADGFSVKIKDWFGQLF